MSPPQLRLPMIPGLLGRVGRGTHFPRSQRTHCGILPVNLHIHGRPCDERTVRDRPGCAPRTEEEKVDYHHPGSPSLSWKPRVVMMPNFVVTANRTSMFFNAALEITHTESGLCILRTLKGEMNAFRNAFIKGVKVFKMLSKKCQFEPCFIACMRTLWHGKCFRITDPLMFSLLLPWINFWAMKVKTPI